MKKIIKTYSIVGLANLSINWLITKMFFRPARLIRIPFYIRGRASISWGEGFTTGVGTRFDAFINGPDKDRKIILIGARVQINDYVHIGAINSVVIGDDVLIASKVYITDHDHGIYKKSYLQSSPDIPPAARQWKSSPVVIEDRVWLGENVCVLAGVKIGKGSIIGAGSVVTHDIPADSIAVGTPAKVIKKFDRTLKQWLKVG